MNRRAAQLAVGLIFVAALAANAAGGDVVWSIQRDGYNTDARPAVAPDGSVYWTFRGLYKLDPATGQVEWFNENNASALVAIGPDGTIYGTGSVNQGTPEAPLWHPTATALSPDNQLLWEWVYDPAYWYPEAGPTLGPDGNLYYISYGGYHAPGHLFSMNSNGGFRWELRRFANGNGVQNLTFAGGNVLKVGQYTSIPSGPLVNTAAGMAAADMQSGQLVWAEAFAANGDPIVSPANGHILVTPGLYRQFRSYTPAHELEWTYTAEWSPTGINTIAVGPEGNSYISHATNKVVSLTPTGATRWSVASALPAPYYYPPTVSPDGSSIIYTTTGSGSTAGYVTALRTSDGSKLWEMTLPAPSEGYGPVRGYGGVRFSPDGNVAYVPAVSVCYCGPTGYQERGHLFAIDARGGTTPCAANCDGSNVVPVLNANDFQCFLNKFAAGDAAANCDQSTAAPVLNANDFQCFLNKFAAGCP